MGTTEADVQQLVQEYGVHPSLFAGETPQRKVEVAAFFIDRFPVTNSQYKKFIDGTGRHAPRYWKGKDYPAGQADWPVTYLGWADADAYARWAGKRLPTEAEWEKAARGDDGRQYPWGNEWDDQACRIDDGTSPQTPPPLAVGCFPKGASPYGVMDLAGNVAEWTSTPSQPPDAQRSWAWYVVKGAGTAHHLRFNFRCAARNFSAHTSRRHRWLGFRCALDVAGGRPATTPRETSDAVAPGSPPPTPPAAAPRGDLYGKEPITITHGGGHGASLFVPYFPGAVFSLNLPEQVGVTSYPFGWGSPHTPIRWKFNDTRTRGEYNCTFDDKAELTVTLTAQQDCVEFTIAIRNLTDQLFSRPTSNTCLNNHGARYFEDPERDRTLVWTDDGATRLLEMRIGGGGEPLHGGCTVAQAGQATGSDAALARHPIIAVQSRDREWIVAQTYAEGVSVANNAHYTCLHSRPRWPDIPPGEERSVTGRLYFLRGGAEELLARWREDFLPDK